MVWSQLPGIGAGGLLHPARRPMTAAVLLIHGADDRETPPDHSQRIFAALPGVKRLIIVPGAGHNGSLRGDVWSEIDRWIDAAIGAS